MPAHPTEYVKTISRYERAQQSRLGNPAWIIWFTDGHTARTETDGSVGYDVENFKPGTTVRVKAHPRSGRIWAMEEDK